MRLVISVVLVVLIGVSGLGVFKTVTKPAHLYSKSGTFSACPARPSCVSSIAEGERYIDPLQFVGNATEAQAQLLQIISDMGGDVQANLPGYVHAVFTTEKMRYRDDLELLIRAEGVIEVRSISRFAYRDLGVNATRVEKLRGLFVQKVPATGTPDAEDRQESADEVVEQEATV